MSAATRTVFHRLLHPTLAVALAAAASLAVPASTQVSGVAVPDVISLPAAISARADTAWLLAAANAGPRQVVVGERGIVLLSDDDGNAWRQAAATPTSVTLTAVQFASATRGWATGHAGLILATDDGGEHWHKQLDGNALAQLSLAKAQAAVATAADKTEADKAEANRALGAARRLVSDGADKPFLDLCFTDPRHGFAVGAYNLFVRTDDGGATWLPAADLLPNPKASHLYAIRARGDLIVIAGEQGLLLRSTDGGRSFKALESPYAGSFFTLALLPGGELVAAGLRGNAFRSTDQGDSWQAIPGLPPVSWLASAVSADGTAWLGNQAGQVFVSHDAGRRWTPVPPQPGPPSAPLTSLLPVDSGQLLTTTLRGMRRISVVQVAGNQVAEK